MITNDMPPLASYEMQYIDFEEEYNLENYEDIFEYQEEEKIMKPLDKVSITSGFTGSKKYREYKYNGKLVKDHHYGVDIIGGTKIYATADGKVTKVVNKGKKGGTMCLIRIQHKDYQSAYYHIASGSARVKVGDWVKKGDYIADIGDTGKATGKHLHFQIDKGSDSTAINPTAYAKGNKELKGLSKPSKDWETGTYRTLEEKYIRKTPEVKSNNKVKYCTLLEEAKEKCFEDKLGYARYKIGVEVDITQFANDKKGNIWGKTKNTWLCVKDSSGDQVEKV